MTDAEIKASLTDFDAFWLTLWAEARSEPIEGIVGVACVIRNRVLTPGRFGGTYAAVCLAPKQFSCWNDGPDENHQRVMALARAVSNGLPERIELQRDPIIRQVRWVARGVQSGELLDRTKGASHYLTVDLYETAPPTWARDVREVLTLGTQVFLRAA